MRGSREFSQLEVGLGKRKRLTPGGRGDAEDAENRGARWGDCAHRVPQDAANELTGTARLRRRLYKTDALPTVFHASFSLCFAVNRLLR